MTWLIDNKIDANAIVMFTDNDTWAGDKDPYGELQRYRQMVKHPVKAAVVAFTAGDYSVFRSKDDPDCIDIAGADASIAKVLEDFLS